MRFLILILIGIGLLGLNSCCHMKDCQEELNQLVLTNFSANELDTIYVKKYAKNSNFLKAEDSFTYCFYKDDSAYIVSLYGRDTNGAAIVYSFDKDYLVYLSGLKKSYKITNITTKDEKCNTCFPVGSTSYRKMDYYNVNGILQTAKYSYQINIKK